MHPSDPPLRNECCSSCWECCRQKLPAVGSFKASHSYRQPTSEPSMMNHSRSIKAQPCRHPAAQPYGPCIPQSSLRGWLGLTGPALWSWHLPLPNPASCLPFHRYGSLTNILHTKLYHSFLRYGYLCFQRAQAVILGFTLCIFLLQISQLYLPHSSRLQVSLYFF